MQRTQSVSPSAAPFDRRNSARGVFLALLLLVCVALFLAIRGLPFFSEDYAQLGEAERLSSIWQALGPVLEPLRPLQHLPFYLLSRCAEPDPAWTRAVALLSHAGSVLLLARLARNLGAEPREAWLAAALFLVFPCLKALVWGAAITNPLRVLFLLGALVAFAERRGALLLACFLLALASHEAAISLPPILLLFAWLRGEKQRLREPAFLVCAGTTVVYTIYLAFLRPQRHDSLKPLDSLPANAVKALLALAPEPLRVLCVESFRGHGGALLLVCGSAVFLLWLALIGWALLRGGPTLRFLVLAIAVDFFLPFLSAGFSQRYAYLAGGFVAIGLVLASRSLRARTRALLFAAVAASWCYDTWRDGLEYHAAGALELRVLEELRSERARAGPGKLIAVLDLPDMGGSERDLPLFNWGAEQCLRRHGIDGPWVFWRTHEYATSSDIPPLPQGGLEHLRDATVRTLRFDPQAAQSPLPLRVELE